MTFIYISQFEIRNHFHNLKQISIYVQMNKKNLKFYISIEINKNISIKLYFSN